MPLGVLCGVQTGAGEFCSLDLLYPILCSIQSQSIHLSLALVHGEASKMVLDPQEAHPCPHPSHHNVCASAQGQDLDSMAAVDYMCQRTQCLSLGTMEYYALSR